MVNNRLTIAYKTFFFNFGNIGKCNNFWNFEETRKKVYVIATVLRLRGESFEMRVFRDYRDGNSGNEQLLNNY